MGGSHGAGVVRETHYDTLLEGPGQGARHSNLTYCPSVPLGGNNKAPLYSGHSQFLMACHWPVYPPAVYGNFRRRQTWAPRHPAGLCSAEMARQDVVTHLLYSINHQKEEKKTRRKGGE